MSRVYNPGSVVLCHYTDLEGKENTGYFCVLYDEQLDPSSSYKGNFIALKITTSYNMMLTNHTVPLSGEKNPFFPKDCMALCSRPYVLEKSNVVEFKGILHPQTLRQVYRGYRRFESELERQTEDFIY